MIDEVVEYALYVALLVALAIPLSTYINKVMSGGTHVLSRAAVPIENGFCRLIGVDKNEQMDWKKYAKSVCVFSIISLALLMAILMLQGFLPFNPEGWKDARWIWPSTRPPAL